MFSNRDIIDIAIKIEENGESVYRKAMADASDPEIAGLLGWMADQEAEHIQKFMEIKKTVMGKSGDSKIEKFGRSILQGMIGDQNFSLQDTDFSKIDNMESLFSLSIRFEKDTIIFYEMLALFIEDSDAINILERIIDEEQRHVERLETCLADFKNRTKRQTLSQQKV